MRRKYFKRGLAALLGLLLAIMPPISDFGPVGITSYAYTGTATVKAAALNVRSGAGTNYSAIGRLSSGNTVTVTGEQTGTDGNKWYQIRFKGSGGAVQTGYVSSVYIRIPVSYTADSNFEAYLNSQGFPESYKDSLRQLHVQYPNWVFKSVNTGLDWNTVIENEALAPRNLVSAGSISSWKSVDSGAYNWDNSTWTGFDGSNWVAASDEIIKYYMDPRNFLDDTYVFQFLSQEYNGGTQTKEGLETMVKDSFLSGSTDSTGTDGSNFSGGPGSSYGPGGSSGKSSGGGSYDDSQYGPGVTGNTPGGKSTSSGSGGISQEGPHASITPRKHFLLGAKVSLEGPGSGNGPSSGGPSGGGSASSSSPGSGSSLGGNSSPGVGSAPGNSSPGGGSSPGNSSPGGGSAPGGNASSGSSSAPGGNSSPGVGSSPGSSAPGGGSSGTSAYVEILMKAGAQSGVSPYVLAAMIMQEQGKGTSPLISGNCSGYEGYYNFFNVEAYQSGSMSAIQRGLWYASQSGSYGRPWNTVEKSILGGSMNYGDNYVKAGQNTFYLKKFNVQGNNLYKHQYMSNVQAAASEGAKLSQAYTAHMKNSALEFLIPVFNNLPAQACPAPTGDGSPNNKLSGLGVNGFGLTPTFNRDTESYNLIVDNSVSGINVQASAADSRATVNGTGNVSLGAGTTDVTVTVTAQNGTNRTYTIHVAKQSGGLIPGSVSTPGGTIVSPGGSTGGGGQGPGGSNGPGTAPGGGADGPGGSNVTIVTVTN